MNTAFAPEWVRYHADRTPDAPAVATVDARLSYGELADRFGALAAHLAAFGVVPGDRVLVALPNVVASCRPCPGTGKWQQCLPMKRA